MVSLNMFHLFISSLGKIINMSNLCLILNYKIEPNIKSNINNTLDTFNKQIKKGDSINLDELFMIAGQSLVVKPDIELIFKNVYNICIDIIICNMVEMLGFRSSLALLSLIKQLDIREIKKTIEDIRKDILCPNHPLNKVLNSVEFFIKFLNVPTQAISDIIFPSIPSFIKDIFMIEDKKN